MNSIVDLDDWIAELRPHASFRGGLAVFDDPIPLFTVAGILLGADSGVLDDEPKRDEAERRVFEALGSRLQLRQVITVEIGAPYSRYYDRVVLVGYFDDCAAIVYRGEDDQLDVVAFGTREAVLRLLREPAGLPSWSARIDGHVLRVVVHDEDLDHDQVSRIVQMITT